MEPVLRFAVDESPFGVRDMAGSLLEFCVGQFAVGKPFKRPWRGGHWHVHASGMETELRCAYREEGNPSRPGDNDGFRLVAWRRLP